MVYKEHIAVRNTLVTIEYWWTQTDKVRYTVNDGRAHNATVHLYEWVNHPHGNAPSGTPYGYFIVDIYGYKRRVKLCV